jgi:threonine dehydrogenase-like Zn-dependent dehydrogenase
VKALVREAGQVAVVEVSPPVPREPDDVLVRVIVAGICRTDIQVAHGLIAAADPITLGHELGGVVVACGPAVDPAVDRIAVGDLVTADPRVDGGFLGVTRHGVFAELVVIPARNLFRVPTALGPRRAAYVEPVAAALAVLPAIIRSSEDAEIPRVAIAGASRFARLVRGVLAAHGITACELEGAAPGSVDVAIETTGSASELAALIEAVRLAGTIIVKSRGPGTVALSLRDLIEKELTLRAVRYASFERAIELLATGALAIDELLGTSFPLARHREAFAAGESHKLFFTLDDASCAA